jgi:hypothetical protein
VGESSKAYAHFCVYRDAGKERSLRKLAADAKTTSQLRQLQHWSSRWKWVERCQEYEDRLEYQGRLQQEKQRREMNERHAKVGQFSQNVALRRLEKLVRDIEEGKSTMSAADTARLLDIGVKIERLARGEPTDVQENVGSDGGRIESDRRAFIFAVRAALGFNDSPEVGYPKRYARQVFEPSSKQMNRLVP